MGYNTIIGSTAIEMVAIKGTRPTGSARVSLAALVLAVTACQGDDGQAPFRNYLTRLGRVLDTPVPAVSAAVLPQAPRPAQLRHELPPGKLGTLDFLAISGCEVQVTIGKRNSSLGRMAKESQRLLLELEYLALAPDCIDYQRRQGRSDVADTLEQAWQLKKQQLPALAFNATLGSQEYRDFWRRRSLEASYPASTSSSVITALEAVNAMVRRWLSGDYRADNLEFEILLGEIATGDGGTLLAALARQGEWLASADRLLADRMQRKPLCTPGFRPDAADILHNVVVKYFIGEIQPAAAALERRRQQLLSPVALLEAQLSSALPNNYLEWQGRREALLGDFAAAPKRHVEQIMAIQAPCTAG